jgi:hypothetical protein
MQNYTYLGSGKAYLREVGAAAGFLEVGNCSQLRIDVNEDVKEMKDYTQVGGGQYNEVRRIQSVQVAMILHDLHPTNLARALFGGTASVASAAVTAQALGAGYINAFLPFPALAQASPAPVIKASNGTAAVTRVNTTAYTVGQYLIPAAPNSYYYKVTTAGTSAAAPPIFPTVPGTTVTDGTAVLTCMGLLTLVINTDYDLRSNGVFLLTGAQVTSGETFTADFTKTAADVIQALIASAKDYELYFDGLNEGRTGKQAIVDVYRVKMGASKAISLIGDDFAALEVTGRSLKDITKIGAGVSQYFRAELAQ